MDSIENRARAHAIILGYDVETVGDDKITLTAPHGWTKEVAFWTDAILFFEGVRSGLAHTAHIASRVLQGKMRIQRKSEQEAPSDAV